MNFLKKIEKEHVNILPQYEEELQHSPSLRTSLQEPPSQTSLREVYPKWEEVMKNVSTQRDFKFAIEILKRDIWEYISSNRGNCEEGILLNGFGIPKIIFTPLKTISIGSFVIGKRIELTPYKIIKDWFEELGFLYEIIEDNKIIYFKIFKNN